MINISNLFW